MTRYILGALALCIGLAAQFAHAATLEFLPYGGNYYEFTPGGSSATLTGGDCAPICGTITFNNTLAEDTPPSGWPAWRPIVNSYYGDFKLTDGAATHAWRFSYYVHNGEAADTVSLLHLDGVFGAYFLDEALTIAEGTSVTLNVTNPNYVSPSPVPLPAAGVLLIGALGSLAYMKRRRGA